MNNVVGFVVGMTLEKSKDHIGYGDGTIGYGDVQETAISAESPDFCVGVRMVHAKIVNCFFLFAIIFFIRVHG